MASRAITFAPKTFRSPEIVAEVLLRMSEGASLEKLYNADPAKWPHPTAWCDWVASDSSLALACARVRQHAADSLAAQAMDIVDTEPELVVTKEGTRMDSAHVTWLKNRADLRMKRAAQLNPAAYGDKLLHAGHDGGTIKAELAHSLPEIAERLREARRVAKEGAPVAVGHLPPAPASEALLEALSGPSPSAGVRHAAPSRHGANGAGLEPGDPGMEFV